MSNNKRAYFFEDIPVIGKLSAVKIVSKLKEMGDPKAEAYEKAVTSKGIISFGKKGVPAWKNTAHTYGFIPPIDQGSSKFINIAHASNIPHDTKLTRITITLGAIRAAEYPGGGMHRVLFDFYAKNYISETQIEELHFNQVYRVQQGESAAVIGYPIFAGLNVGPEGVAFKCFTVNVKNDNDEAILNFLDSEVFKNGLKLATTVQPAIAPLTSIAVGVTKMIASRNQNVPVQDFFMGLDYTNVAFRARLAEGAYIAVQIPEDLCTHWKWDDWVYSKDNGLVVNKNDTNLLIPYNYIVFSVSSYPPK